MPPATQQTLFGAQTDSTPEPTDDDSLVSPRLAAALAGVDLVDVHRAIRSGDVRTTKIRGELFVRQADVDRAARIGKAVTS